MGHNVFIMNILESLLSVYIYNCGVFVYINCPLFIIYENNIDFRF